MICFFVVVCFLLVDQNRWDSEAIARRKILSSSSSADNAAHRLQVMLHSMRLCNRNSCLSHRSWLRHLISTCSLTTVAHFCVPKWKPCFWGSWCSTCLEQPRLENVSCSLSKTKPVASWKNAQWDLPRKTLYALSPMIVSDVAEGVHQVLVSPPDSAQADFQFDPKKFRFSEHETLLQCKSNVKEFPNACGGDFTVEAWQYDYLWNRNFMYMALCFYSTYTPEDGKIHEMVQAQFR